MEIASGVSALVEHRLPVTHQLAPLLAPAGYTRTIKHHRFAISIGSRRVAIERMRERYTVTSAMTGDATRPLPGKLLFGVATAGLFLAYVALLPSPSPATRYSAELAIPDKAIPVPAIHRIARTLHIDHATPRLAVVAKARAAAVPGIVSPMLIMPAASIDATLDSADAGGDIVDLPSTAGSRALEVFGAQRQIGGKACRDVQIFSRDAAGKVSVEPVTRCGKL